MTPEYHAGPEASKRFEDGMTKLSQTPKDAAKETSEPSPKPERTSKDRRLCLPRPFLRCSKRPGKLARRHSVLAVAEHPVSAHPFVKTKGESSKIVPTLSVNCFLQPLQCIDDAFWQSCASQSRNVGKIPCHQANEDSMRTERHGSHS